MARRVALLVSMALVTAQVVAACATRPDDDTNAGAAGERPATMRGESPSMIVRLDEAAQRRAGLQIEALAAAALRPEVRAYGWVLDPVPLAALVADLATAQALDDASQAERRRLTTLAAQDNASERMLQSAEAAAARDAAHLENARLQLLASWGGAIAGQEDLPAFVRSLGRMEAALVRVDLPAGEALEATPRSARLVTLVTGESPVEAELLGRLPAVDSHSQGRAFLFLVRSPSSGLVPGAAVTAYLPLAGDAESGVVVPREAILRHEGEAWLFLQADASSFRRRAIVLERPLAGGWFVATGVAPGDRVVVRGAQALFSAELAARGAANGEPE